MYILILTHDKQVFLKIIFVELQPKRIPVADLWSSLLVKLSELRRRLDHAEEDREELQEELRREREARERLEHTISDLKQQMKESVPPASMDSPLSLASSDTHMSPTP